MEEIHSLLEKKYICCKELPTSVEKIICTLNRETAKAKNRASAVDKGIIILLIQTPSGIKVLLSVWQDALLRLLTKHY